MPPDAGATIDVGLIETMQELEFWLMGAETVPAPKAIVIAPCRGLEPALGNTENGIVTTNGTVVLVVPDVEPCIAIQASDDTLQLHGPLKNVRVTELDGKLPELTPEGPKYES